MSLKFLRTSAIFEMDMSPSIKERRHLLRDIGSNRDVDFSSDIDNELDSADVEKIGEYLCNCKAIPSKLSEELQNNQGNPNPNPKTFSPEETKCPLGVFSVVDAESSSEKHCMPVRRERTRGLITQEQLKAASDEVLNNSVSVRSVAQAYKMCHVTLYRYVKKRQAMERGGSNVLPITGYHSHFRVFSDVQEKQLVNYLTKSADMYFGLCPKEVKKLAYQLARRSNCKYPGSWDKKEMAGKDWFRGFMRRNKQLSLRRPEPTSLSRATSFNRFNVDAFFKNLSDVLKRPTQPFEAQDVWNMDETGITTVQTPDRIVSRMALKALVSTKVDTMTFRPAPLHIKILKLVDSHRVASWVFADSHAKPAAVQKNRTAIISDGHSLTKIVLFEGYSLHVQEGSSYMLKGHSLRGHVPPYQIHITRTTIFFRGPALQVPEELVEQAGSLLCPPSPIVHLGELQSVTSLLSVEGEIMEKIKCMFTNVQIVGVVEHDERCVEILMADGQDGAEAIVTLWREAAIFNFKLGQQVTISHLVKKDGGIYGLQLQSCNHSQIEIQSVTEENVTVTGVMEDESSENLQLLLQTGDVILINKESWEPYDQTLEDTAVQVCVSLKENLVIAIKLPST
ncbi:uncharacterized protein V6R79_019869 [Siganus canaliculatus]